MKKFLSIIIALVIVISIAIYYDDAFNYVLNNYIFKKENSIISNNNYSRNNDYEYVQHIDNFYPKNEKELMNVLFSILDSGMDDFSFFCDDSYITCKDDIINLSNDNVLLSIINNFVSPFNSYNKLFISINNFDKITIKVEKLYNKDEINEINNYIKSVSNEILNDKMTNREKIKVIHDYIINNTSYDEDYDNLLANNQNNNFSISHKAIGIIRNKKAICSGYTDLMGLFLEYLKIPNFKVSNDKHIWNAVFLNNKWYHLDLTWDDPVTTNGQHILLYDYFLISSIDLKIKNPTKHEYDESIYLELK